MRGAPIALLLLALAAPAQAWAPEDAFGRRVTTIAVEVDGVRTADTGLLDLVEVKAGEPLQAKAVRDSIAHLYSLGRFEDVRVHAVPESGGVAIRIELVPVHSVQRLEFRGQTGLDEAVLRRAITERFGLAGAATRSSEVVEFLGRYYRERGFPSPSVSARTEVEKRDGRAILVFDVTSGPRVTVSGVIVEGNAPETLAAAKQSLGLAPGRPYDKQAVDEQIAAYVTRLRKRGYYEAQGEHSLRTSPDGRTAELVVTLDGGPHVTIEFQGDPVPERERDELVPIAREGSVDEDLLEDSARRLSEHLRGQGYRDAEVTYARVPKGGELAIIFRVSRGPAYIVSGTEVSGNASIPLADLAGAIRLREGQPFLDTALDASVSAIADIYHRRGFADVKVTSAIDPEPGSSPVRARARILVTEGVRTVVGVVTLEGNTAIPSSTLTASAVARSGLPYYPPQLLMDRDAILLQYMNRGYRTADVTVKPTLSKDRARVDVVYAIHEGPQIFVDHVLVVGNEKTSAETIRHEVQLRPGDPIGFEGLAESQRRVSALGLFRRVRITEIDHGAEAKRDLLVTVEEAPATTVGYGGGVEVARRLVRTASTGVPDERIEFAPRGFFEIGRRNLFGHNRSVNLFTRVSLRLRSDSTVTTDGTQPVADFNEYRVLGTYRQPKLFGDFDFLASGFAEQAARTSFDFKRLGARAELGRRFSPRVSASLRYSLDRTETFNETFTDDEDALLIDRLFPRVRLSTVSATAIRDARDDALAPTSGTLLWIDGEMAARAIGSEVGFAKTFVQGFLYRRLPGTRPVVFATGARVGVARGLPYETVELDARGNPVIGPDGQPVLAVVRELPASERFFAGGDTTVRGFALDQLGTPDTLDANGFPRGGNAVVVLNAELRVPVWGDLGAATFVDAGNVFRGASDLDLSQLRPTAGVGLRYRSPVGPLRLDLGFKLDSLRVIRGELERRHAWYISFGQAF